jgi:hypothetical protein
MTVYYTAKEIEELAARGVQQLEIGPGITLTDFARETAQQLNIALIDSAKRATSSTAAPPVARNAAVGDKYNKPSGCMHAASVPAPNVPAETHSQATSPSVVRSEDADPNTVNKLIDLVGKAIKRGG